MNTAVHTHQNSQTFTSFNRDNSTVLCQGVLVDHTPSLICSFDSGNKIAKLIKPRRRLEILKMFIFRSRIHKELRGNKTLRQLGLDTPTIYQHGYGIIPHKNYRYLGFYTMDNLTRQGLRESTSLFGKAPSKARQAFIGNLCQGLTTMKNQCIVFSDLTLGNMFVDNNGAITWIDTGVTNYKLRPQKRFKQKFNYSIKRFINIHKALLDSNEKNQLNQLLFSM